MTVDEEIFKFLKPYFIDLDAIFIVSQIAMKTASDIENGYFKVEILRAEGQKCERCWNYSERVGEFEKYPTVCERCITALSEIEKLVTA